MCAQGDNDAGVAQLAFAQKDSARRRIHGFKLVFGKDSATWVSIEAGVTADTAAATETAARNCLCPASSRTVEDSAGMP